MSGIQMVAALPDAATVTGTGPHSPVSQNAQNLFEFMAENVRTLPRQASPADLGRTMLEDLKGFVERSGSFSSRAQRLVSGQDTPLPASFSADVKALGNGTAPASPQVESVGDKQIQRVVASLGMMFDHSIETQMVVRGATQVSGAANTLLKGQ